MIRFIATDMDGTLLNDNGIIDNNVLSLIPKLHSKNILFAAASGRFYSQLMENFKQINSDILFIAHNGALIKYNNGKTIYSHSIKPKYIHHVLELKRIFGEEIFLATSDIAYTKNPSNYMLNAFDLCGVPSISINSFDNFDLPVYKITYFMANGITSNTLDYLKNNLNDNLEFVVSGSQWIDIMNKGITKGNAIEIIQNSFNISKNNTVVFGDYYNDISMFKNAYYSYAMKNSPEDVKKCANFIADSNNNNGVYKIISKYI